MHISVVTTLIIVLGSVEMGRADFWQPKPKLTDGEQATIANTLGSFISLTDFTPARVTFDSVILSNVGGPTKEKMPLHHIVQSGETLSAIAEKYGLHSGSIILANPSLKDTELIHQGDDLIVPDQDASEDDLKKEYADREARLAKAKSYTSQTIKEASIPASGAYGMPLYSYQEISQYFSRAHQAIDFAARPGSPIHAVHSGCISRIASGWNGGYGRMIILNHGGGMSSLYAHLSSISVGVGECVAMGDIIGYSGNTGNSTGPHLHFEIRKNNQPVEPLQYVR